MPVCPERDDVFETYEYRTIEGILASTCKGTCSKSYCYVISYDDELTTGYQLKEADIEAVFCKDCLTDYIEDVAGNEVFLRNEEDGSTTLVSQHGCEYNFAPGAVCISQDEGNILIEDMLGCLYVPASEICISEDEGNIAELDEDGCLLVPNPVCISEDEGNIAELDESGCIFVPASGGGSGTPWDLLLFGDGGDGDSTVAVDTLLAYPVRTYHFDNLTIDAAGTLHPFGYAYNDLSGSGDDREYYQILVRGTLTINGTISADGPNASGQTGGAEGTFGVALAAPGPGGADDAGANGGAAQTNGSPTSRNLGRLGNGYMGGGLGGAGGDGGGASGGVGYVPVVATDGYFYRAGRLLLSLVDFSMGQSYIEDAIGGGSGGGSGGGGTNAGGTGGVGGGSGAGGGCVYIAAKNIVIGASGVISCKGGNGGSGAAGVGGDASGGGGGGGGGGGLIYCVYETISNVGTFDVSGGTGGTGGAGVGAGSAGTAGVDGVDGHIYLLNTTTGLFETP